MKALERGKIRAALIAIESGEFNQRDVDALLIYLRDHAAMGSTLKEVGHFIAHSGARDRGETRQLVLLMTLGFRFFSTYNETGFDLNAPMPRWVKDLLILKIDLEYGAGDAKNHGITKSRLKQYIRRNLVKQSDLDMVCFMGRSIPPKAFSAIQFILSKLQIRAMGTTDDVIDDIISIVERFNIEFSPAQLRLQADKISLCILLNSHMTEIKLDGGRKALLRIVVETLPKRAGRDYGPDIAPPDELGDLCILVDMPGIANGKDATFCVTIFESALKAGEWCDDSLLADVPLSWGSPTFNMDLRINGNFQLTADL